MKSIKWYVQVVVVTIIVCCATIGCAAFDTVTGGLLKTAQPKIQPAFDTVTGGLLKTAQPKIQPAPIQINYRGCLSAQQCVVNADYIRTAKNACNAFPNYDCAQYDPLIAHLEDRQRELLVRERDEEARVEKLREDARLRYEESERRANEAREKRENAIRERIVRAEESRRLVDECLEKRAATKRACDAWINTNCKPVLVSRTGCQQFTERTWGRVKTWTECIDMYKAQCAKPDTAPPLCKPEAANGEVFSNVYIDHCSISTADIKRSEGL